MKQYNFIIIMVLVFAALQVNAQQIPVTNQYIFNPYLYNPARAGESGFSNINLSHRNQWVDMPDSPISFIGTFDTKFKDSNVGVGGMIFSDQSHLITNYGGRATYAYHIPFNEDKTHRLSVGLSAGVVSQRFDFTNATVDNESDITILDRTDNTVNFDMAAGLNYHFKGLNVGVSVPQIFNSNLKYNETGNYDNVEFSLERHFLISASYLMRFGSSKSISLEPIVLARKVAGIPLQLDANLLVGYKDKVWLGGGYRSVNSLSDASAAHGSVAVRVKEKFMIGYTYEAVLGSQAKVDLGNTHEFTVGYRFGGKSNKDKEMMERLEGLEGKVGNLEGQINALKNDVEDNKSDIDAKVDALDEKIEKGILNAEQMAALQARVAKNESDIAALKSNDAAMNAEMSKIRSELAATNAKLGSMNQGSKSSAFLDAMGSVLFTKGSSELTAEGRSKLDAIHSNLVGRSGYTLFISGNASSEGSEEYNMGLSMRRANSVKNYLKTRGISGGSIFLLPYGESVPTGGQTVNSNDRRVDIFITN